jgi:hypothetical protein
MHSHAWNQAWGPPVSFAWESDCSPTLAWSGSPSDHSTDESSVAQGATALLPYPGLILPLAVGSLLPAFTVAAYPLFIGASAGALLRDEIARPLITRYGAGVTYTSSVTRLAASNREPPLYEARPRFLTSLPAGRTRMLGRSSARGWQDRAILGRGGRGSPEAGAL